MLTLKNFDKQIVDPILQRGKDYFTQGNVSSLEEVVDQYWTAEVEGSETYNVEVTLENGDGIQKYSCDCPFEGEMCKHVVAVLFALRKEVKTVVGTAKPVKPKIEVFESILRDLTEKEVKDFVHGYATKNKEFKLDFELFFAEKDSRVDVEKKYADILKKLIRKHSAQGFIDYRSSVELSREVNRLLETGTEYLVKNNVRDAFIIAKTIIGPLMEAVAYSDDSSGGIGDNIFGAIQILEAIANHEKASFEIKEQVFNYTRNELGNGEYFNYGDFGYQLFGVFRKLGMQINKIDVVLGFMDVRGSGDGYDREFFILNKVGFLREIGRVEEAEKLVMQHMDIVEIREGQVELAIERKDYPLAKRLITEGIRIAQEIGHIGTESKWEEILLRIAHEENDTLTVRTLSRKFAFKGIFSKDHYRKWKSTFPETDWKEVIEDYIAVTIKRVTDEWNRTKNNYYWKPTFPPVLEAIGNVYIEEGYAERLFELVKQRDYLDITLQYQPHLVKDFRAELLEMYVVQLEEFGVGSNGRGEYKDLVRKMKAIIKDIPEGKTKILGVAQKLKGMFSSKPKRPALLEELDTILKG
jgi:hypothetical protein